MSLQRYSYRAGKLHTVLQENGNLVFLRTLDGLFAEMHGPQIFLLETDLQGSVYRGRQAGYACHGYDPINFEYSGRPGFNGERKESWASCYALGRGYRLYSTLLLRFASPDNLSPFGAGGLNAYAYCAGDPVNHTDPSGRMPMPNRRSPSLPMANGHLSRSRLRTNQGPDTLRRVAADGGNSKSPPASPDRRSMSSQSSVSSRDSTPSPTRRLSPVRGQVLDLDDARTASPVASNADSSSSEVNWDNWSDTASQRSSTTTASDDQRWLDRIRSDILRPTRPISSASIASDENHRVRDQRP